MPPPARDSTGPGLPASSTKRRGRPITRLGRADHRTGAATPINPDLDHVTASHDHQLPLTPAHGVAVIRRTVPFQSTPQAEVISHVAPPGPLRGLVTVNFIPIWAPSPFNIGT